MTPQEQALTDHYLRLLARTGEDFAWPDIRFAPTHDGDKHVECEPDGGWSTVVTDRGHEYDRKRFTDLHELMFGLCAGATHEAAMKHVSEPGLHAHELQDRATARQVELMRRIDPDWAERISRNYAKWRKVRARMAASDALEERLATRNVWLVYVVCPLIVAAAASLALFSD